MVKSSKDKLQQMVAPFNLVVFCNFIFSFEDQRLKKSLDHIKVIFNNRFNLKTKVKGIFKVASLGITLSSATTFPTYVIGKYKGNIMSTTASHYGALMNKNHSFKPFEITVEERHVTKDILPFILVHEIFHAMGFLSCLGNEYAGTTGPIFLDSELVFMPPSFMDLIMYKNKKSMMETYYSKLNGLCWNKMCNPINRKPEDDIFGRISSFLHHQSDEIGLDKLDTTPFMEDEYYIQLQHSTETIYVMDGFIDKFILGFKKGSSFDHISRGIMHYKGTVNPPVEMGIDAYLEHDPAWDVFCAMGYTMVNMSCPTIVLNEEFIAPKFKNTSHYCTQFYESSHYEAELKYYVSVRGAILFAVSFAILSITFSIARYFYLKNNKRRNPKNLRVFI